MPKFASRAGEKLEFALNTFSFRVQDLVVCDMGSSTGGFVDCLLAYGAKKVYAVDVCYGELDWKLRNNPKVKVMERTNAMYLNLPEKVDLVTIDTGWTKQAKVIPNALSLLKKEGFIISLVKPQYEAGKAKLTREESKKVCERIISELENLPLEVVSFLESPIQGQKGKNYEYLLLLKKKG